METLSSTGIACYTSRDLSLYALGIGCCSNDNGALNRNNSSDEVVIEEEEELRHVYEHHDDFTPFPTFPLVLPFRALVQGERSNTTPSSHNYHGLNFNDYFGMPSFPTPLMNTMNLHEDSSISKIIHLSEKMRLHSTIPNAKMEPTFVKVSSKVCSITPKRIGTIVVIETDYYIQKSNCSGYCTSNNNEMKNELLLLASSESTTLYILKENKNAKATSNFNTFNNRNHQSKLNSPTFFMSSSSSSTKNNVLNDYMKQKKPNCIINQKIPKNQALIYRLSGDANVIHVQGIPGAISSSPPSSLQSTLDHRPILHGLCTLGYAVRAVMTYCNRISKEQSDELIKQDVNFRYVSCQFVNPVFVGDELQTSVLEYWNDDKTGCLFLLFQVKRKNDRIVVVKNGLVEVKFIPNIASVRSKL